MGILPLWGFQLLIGIPLTKLFRLNMALFVLTANISIPPMIPIILFLSVWTGELFFGVDVHLVFNYNLISIDYILELGYIYFGGATILATIAGLFFGLLTYLMLEIKVKR